MYPRKDFKEGMVQALFGGIAHKPGTTYGTVNAGICERFIPSYKSPNAVDLMAASPFPDFRTGKLRVSTAPARSQGTVGQNEQDHAETKSQTTTLLRSSLFRFVHCFALI